MRTFDLVDYKVGEGEYFLKKLSSCHDLFEVQFLFSAYISAIRSVTFCLQACLSDVDGFENWYKIRQEKLRADPQAKFFVEARNISQKVGVIPINYGSHNKGQTLFYFGNSIEFDNLPTEDVVTASTNYFKSILKIVYDCYVDFGTTIDPHQHYTQANYKKLGKSIDDLDEYFVGIRGYTKVKGWPEEYRWQVHRNNLPGCRISDFFVDYLELYKPHPPILPENPEDYNGEDWIPPCLLAPNV